jgi:hypothetical protein
MSVTLNQLGLDQAYSDSFGRTKDATAASGTSELNKINLAFKGWLFESRLHVPGLDFGLRMPPMGEGRARSSSAGSSATGFSDYFALYGGMRPSPVHPHDELDVSVLAQDGTTAPSRTSSFRASYTQGFLGRGENRGHLLYRAMIARQSFGARPSAHPQFDNQFNTCPASIWWMPTTGEYGPLEGFRRLRKARQTGDALWRALHPQSGKIPRSSRQRAISRKQPNPSCPTAR